MVQDTILQGLLKVGGVSALALGIFYLLYKQILALRIFTKLSQNQTFVSIALFAILVWVTAMTALFANDTGFRALIFGNNNVVTQGSTINGSTINSGSGGGGAPP